MSKYPTKSIKIKTSYKMMFDILFSIFKRNKDSFTKRLMTECNIDDTINKFDSINDFYVFISKVLSDELKLKSLEKIKAEIAETGKFKPLEELLAVQTIVRENINFRIADKEKFKLKELKEKYTIYPTGVIVELMIELYVSKLDDNEYRLVKRVIGG